MGHPPTSSLYHTTTTNNSPPAFITLTPKTTSTALYHWPSTGSLTGPPLSIISPLCRPLHSASATQRQCIASRCKQWLTATALYAHSLAMNGVPGCGAPSVGTSAGLATRCGKHMGPTTASPVHSGSIYQPFSPLDVCRWHWRAVTVAYVL